MMQKNRNPLVSCIMCTYGRFDTVKKSLSFWLNQDYDNKELIIFNTAKIPLRLSTNIANNNIRVINQSINSETNKDYTNIGQIRRDSLKYMNGDIYVCWDDDDIFLPHHISLGVKKLIESKKLAWKPKFSLFTPNAGKSFQIVKNNMEASAFLWKEVFNYVNFGDGTGDEHVSWLDYLRKNNEFHESDVITPNESYVYFWGDGLHKQSGSIDELDNFEKHKLLSTDFGYRDKLDMIDVSKYYNMVSEFYKNEL